MARKCFKFYIENPDKGEYKNTKFKDKKPISVIFGL